MARAALSTETIDEFVRMAAESSELQCWKEAESSLETRRLVAEFEEAVWAFVYGVLDPLGLTKPGVTAKQVYEEDAPYLILMTLMGHGVGIWDGQWDHLFKDPHDLRAHGAVGELVREHLGKWADDTGGGELNEAFRNDAYNTGFGFRDLEWPETADWRATVAAPGDSIFIYRAALYCEDDGEQIRAELRGQGKAPADEDDESSYDSDDFPKRSEQSGHDEIAVEETGNVEHCTLGDRCVNAIVLPNGNKIGAWLGVALSPDGWRPLCELLQDDPKTLHEHGVFVRALWAYLYADDLKAMDPPCCGVNQDWSDPYGGLPGYGEKREEIAQVIAPPLTEAERALDHIARVESGALHPDELALLTTTPAAELAAYEVTGLQRHWGLPTEPPPPYHPGLPPRLPQYIRVHEERYGPMRPLEGYSAERLRQLRRDARQSGHYEGLHYNPESSMSNPKTLPDWYQRPVHVPHMPDWYDPMKYGGWMLVQRHEDGGIRIIAAYKTLAELEEILPDYRRRPRDKRSWYAVISEGEYQFVRHRGRP